MGECTHYLGSDCLFLAVIGHGAIQNLAASKEAVVEGKHGTCCERHRRWYGGQECFQTLQKIFKLEWEYRDGIKIKRDKIRMPCTHT